MSDIGDSLREARIRKGLTIKDVEDVTKIRSKYLEALEENDYEVLPGSTYAKAFLRTYASFLKLDPDELLEEYQQRPEVRREEGGIVRNEVVQQPRSRTATERKKQRTRRSQRGYVVVTVLAIVIIFLLAWFGSGRGREQTPTLGSDSFSNATTSTAGAPTTTEQAVEVSSTTTVATTGRM